MKAKDRIGLKSRRRDSESLSRILRDFEERSRIETKVEHPASISFSDDVKKSEWLLNFAYNVGFSASAEFDFDVKMPNLPEAIRLGILLDCEEKFRQGRKEGWKSTRM